MHKNYMCIIHALIKLICNSTCSVELLKLVHTLGKCQVAISNHKMDSTRMNVETQSDM